MIPNEKKNHNHKKRCGVLRSRIDPRDYKAEDIFHMERHAGSSNSIYGNKAIGSEFFVFDPDYGGAQLKLGGNPVYNQGPTMECVAFVCSIIMEKQVFDETSNNRINFHRLYTPQPQQQQQQFQSPNDSNNQISDLQWPDPNNPKITFSKKYIYDHRANINTEGMSGADGMEILAKYGCILETDEIKYRDLHNQIMAAAQRQQSAKDTNDYNYWSNQITDIQSQIRGLQYRIKNITNNNNQISNNGQNHMPDVYASIKTVNGLKESLVNNGPCLMILPFYGNDNDSDGHDNNRQEFWLPSHQNVNDEMGHAVTVVGYSDAQQAFYLRNTWGPNWNGCGHAWFPYASFGLIWEAWTLFRRGTEHLTYHKRIAGAGGVAGTGAGIRNIHSINSDSFYQQHPHDIRQRYLNGGSSPSEVITNSNLSHLAGIGLLMKSRSNKCANNNDDNDGNDDGGDSQNKIDIKTKLNKAMKILRKIESQLPQDTKTKIKSLLDKLIY